MRSLVDWDLASILVLLSSSEMDDGPMAKSRFDCHKPKKKTPEMNASEYKRQRRTVRRAAEFHWKYRTAQKKMRERVGKMKSERKRAA